MYQAEFGLQKTFIHPGLALGGMAFLDSPIVNL